MRDPQPELLTARPPLRPSEPNWAFTRLGSTGSTPGASSYEDVHASGILREEFENP
jgi:hypothetical protein